MWNSLKIWSKFWFASGLWRNKRFPYLPLCLTVPSDRKDNMWLLHNTVKLSVVRTGHPSKHCYSHHPQTHSSAEYRVSGSSMWRTQGLKQLLSGLGFELNTRLVEWLHVVWNKSWHLALASHFCHSAHLIPRAHACSLISWTGQPKTLLHISTFTDPNR